MLIWRYCIHLLCIVLALCLQAVSLSIPFVAVSQVHGADFMREFADPFLEWNENEDEKPFNRETVDRDQSLFANLRWLFYPPVAGSDGGILWRTIRVVSVGVLIAFFVRAGVRFVIYIEDEEELKRSRLNIIYIIYGAALVFMVTWLLGSALNFGTIEGVAGGDNSALEQADDNLVVVVLSFLKGAAFFAAILFLAYYGYKMMQAFDQEEKLSAAKRWILNVFIALIFIKIIDYLYFIAQQEDFKNQAVELIVEASKFLWYLMGICLVIALMYAGYLFVTSSGNDDNISKAKGLIKTIFVVVLVILLFLLVVYQVFNDVLAA